MDQVIPAICNVLALSSMYILVALGFAFLFNMLGIVNFSHGAIYMIGGYVGYILIVALGVYQWLALALATIAVALLGVFLEKYCFRRFVKDFNGMVMVCVAITVILQTTVNIMVGAKTLGLPPFVQGILTFGPVSISYERVVTFAIGAFLLVLVIWFVNWTRWGMQMQAIAQNIEGASLQGININRVSALACAVGCGLAAVAGCLMGAFKGLGPFMGDFMLVKTLMLVILAGLGSLTGIFLAGLVIGGLNAVLPLFMSGGSSEATAVAIVVVLLLIRPKGFFGYEASTDVSNGAVSVTGRTAAKKDRRWAVAACYGGLLAVLAVLPLFFSSPYMMHILILCLIYIMAGESLRTITISGQFPLAHAAFMGIGAYVAGLLSRWLGWPVWITIPVASLASTAIGVLIGFPFARLRALYYAMGSLFFGIGVLNVFTAFSSYTGGYTGFSGIHPIFVGGKQPYYYFFLALTLLSTLALYRLEFSRIGINLKAIAQSHLVASSVGINEGFYRVFVVGFGSFFAGLAGACYAHYNMVISPTSFNFMATLWLMMYVLVGGIDSFAGPIVGTLVLFLMPELFRDLKYYSPYLSAAILLILVYAAPKGIVSLPSLAGNWHGAQKNRKVSRVL